MKHIIACFWLCLWLSDTFSQSCPPNLDFESGTLANWQCSIGTTYNSIDQNTIDLSDTVPLRGRHEIISAQSGDEMDQYGGFPRLCPYGGNYSVKLGNENVGGEAEGISYTFRIPATVDTLTFTYFYAVVFEDPQHTQLEQPRFFVTAYDVLTGEVINCASYTYISTSSLPGFKQSITNPSILYKDWSPVSLQFAGLNGRLVRLEFKTADCTLGGHFGYAYLDVGTACSNILATAPYCVETNSLILNAPYGFKNYTWFNQDYSKIVGTGQSITLTPPPATSGTFFVDMVPYPGFGCRDTASATVIPLPVPDTPGGRSLITFCQGAAPEAVKAIALKGHQLLWYTNATGGIPSTDPPVPSTASPDTILYYVSQKALFGCESLRKKITLIVLPTPTAAYNISAPSQCLDHNNFVFASISGNLNSSTYHWDFGDGHIDSSTSANIHYIYKKHGIFNVVLNVINEGFCSNQTMRSVVVMPAPVAAFDFPSVVCENQTSLSLTDRSSVPDNIGSIDQWSWSIDQKETQGRQVGAFIPDHTGDIPVRLAVSTTIGCRDTMQQIIRVHAQPVADLGYENRLCENEMVILRDLSSIPDGGRDYVSRWTWQADGHPISTSQHPSYLFSAGGHQLTLVAQTNFGCNSLPIQKSILVNQKPYVSLDISDSCVFRTIRYQAHDLNGTVDSWLWNMGSGLKKGAASFTKSYLTEGDQSLILIASTAEGCRDTINRPFRIYDNKSFAGHDTLVAKGQPVYLNAGGGDHVAYTWSPADGLNDPSSEKPIALLDRDQRYDLYSITDKGCDSRSKIFIKRYKGPDIYIPNAFTPNADGTNDQLKVVAIGIKKFLFLSVYNRFGEQVYYSTEKDKGWDGLLHGKLQDAGSYTAVSKAIDYNGNTMTRKESVVLIR